MEKEAITIHAAMEDDMFKMLDNWGYTKELEAGDIKCPCGEIVTKENLAAIKPKDGKVVFYHSIICVD